MKNLMRINTEDSLDYCYFPISTFEVILKIQASHDARIALRTHLDDDSDVYEIFLGERGNTISSIKINNVEPNVVEVETENILSSTAKRVFYIKWEWHNGQLSVAWDDYERLITYRNTNPFPINYIGVSTAYGATGSWVLEGMQTECWGIKQQLLKTSSYWVDYNENIGIPKNAVSVSECGPFVGRALHRESVTPGNVMGDICRLAWGGGSHNKTRFQVLCKKDISWVKSRDGSVPLHALPGGETENNIPLFIGRVCVDGMYYVGKIQPNHQLCYIPFNGREKGFGEYETLVVDYFPIIEWVGR